MPARPPLIGTYAAPAVNRGEVVTCLYRDRDCLITTVTDAPIPWPRCQPRGEQGGSGLWVNDDLVKAIRTESAAALRWWFGVSVTVVWKWRRTFGVGGRATTRGSRAAIRAAARQGAAAMKEKVWSPDELEAKAATVRRIGLRPPTRWTLARGGWTADQVALLGTDHDEAIAKRIGRSPGAVTSKRVGLKIAAHSGRAGGGRSWTATEVALLGTDRDAMIAKKIGRTVRAVTSKRTALKIPAASGWRGGGRPWTAEEVALVGTARDEVIAAKIGRTPMAVRLRRVAMKLPVFDDRRRGRTRTAHLSGLIPRPRRSNPASRDQAGSGGGEAMGLLSISFS